MSQICINVPTFQTQHTIGVEVTLDGKKHVMNYRVESVDWPEELDPEYRIDILRTYIRDYDMTEPMFKLSVLSSSQKILPFVCRVTAISVIKIVVDG